MSRKIIPVFAIILTLSFAFVGCSKNYCLKGKKACSISIERTPCYGTCPIYTMTISNNGLVEFEGKKFVEMEGLYQLQLTQVETDSLFTYLQTLNWSSYDASYGSDYTDLPSNIISYNTKSTKEVKITGKGPSELFDLIKRMDGFRERSGWNRVEVSDLP